MIINYDIDGNQSILNRLIELVQSIVYCVQYSSWVEYIDFNWVEVKIAIPCDGWFVL